MFRKTLVAPPRDRFNEPIWSSPTSPTSPRSSRSLPSLPPCPNSPTSRGQGYVPAHPRPTTHVFYHHPSGSRFLEEAVSAVLSTEGGTERGFTGTGERADVDARSGFSGTGTVSSVEVVPATLPVPAVGYLRTQPSRLQKARRSASRPLPSSATRVDEGVLDSGSDGSSSTWTMASIPTPARSPVPGSLRPISFCPTPHPAESFTEYDRLQVRWGETPSLVLLQAVAPEQSALCSKLLQTSLPSERDAVRDITPRRNGLVDAVLEAYNNHRGLIVRPDDIWLAIVTQFGFFVHGHAEALRKAFIVPEGRCELIIEAGEERYSMDTSDMVDRMTVMMDERFADRTLCEWVMPSFTTTTPLDKMTCAVVMMGMAHNVMAKSFTLQCGIPKVTIEGEKKDWETILSRLDHLKKYGIQTIAWTHLLRPILTRFVSAFEHPTHQGNLDFWNKIVHTERSGNVDYLSGWITAFCVFNAHGRWQGNTLNEERVREHEPKKLLRRADPLQLTPTHFAAVYTLRGCVPPYLALDGFPYPTIACVDVPCGYACMDVVTLEGEYGYERGRAAEKRTVVVAGAIGAQICSTEKTELFRNGLRDTIKPVAAWWWLIQREESVSGGTESERLSMLSLLK